MQYRFKASETLLGIETQIRYNPVPNQVLRFKASETLLGIETFVGCAAGVDSSASKPLKPF